MGSPDFVSASSVEDARVAECSAWVNPEQGDVQTFVDTNVEVTRPRRLDPAGTELSVGVAITATVSDGGEDRVMRSRFSVRVTGVARVPAGAADPEHEARVTAVRCLYPQAQAHLATLAAMTQASPVPTPAMDAERLARAVERFAETSETMDKND